MTPFETLEVAGADGVLIGVVNRWSGDSGRFAFGAENSTDIG